MTSHESRRKEPINEIIETFGETISISDTKANIKHGKMSKCRVKISPVGVFVTRKSRRCRYSGSGFISNFDILGVELQEKHTLRLVTKGNAEGILVSCPDPIKFTETLCGWRNELFSGSPLAKPLSLIGFEGEIHPKEVPHVELPNTFRYVAACAKYKGVFDPATLEVFRKFDRGKRDSIVFDGHLGDPTHPNVISYPIVHEPKLNLLVFRRFTSVLLGRIVHTVLKRNKSLRVLGICDYDDFKFELMNLVAVENPSVVSLYLSNIGMGAARFPLFLSELSEYQGTLQSLVFHQVKFTPVLMKYLESFVMTKRCFATLEVLKFSKIDIQRDDMLTVFNSLITIASRLPVLVRFCMYRWTSGVLRLRTDPRVAASFVTSQTVRSLTITNCDLVDIIRPIHFEKQTQCIEFAGCRFHAASLTNLLISVRQIPHKVILAIDRPVMSSEDRAQFWAAANQLPVMDNILELGWARNFVTVGYVEEFCRIFLTPSLRFLDISSVFKLANAKDVCVLLTYLGKLNLIGLTLGGPYLERDGAYDYGDHVPEIFPYIQRLKSLQYFDFSRHGFTAASAQSIVDLCKSLPNLKQIGCDSSKLENLTDVFDLYEKLASVSTITAIQKPITDLNRFAHGYPGGIMSNAGFARFYAAVIKTSDLLSREVRSAYIERYNDDFSHIIEFQDSYPVSAMDLDVTDPYSLSDYSHGNCFVGSLLGKEQIPVCNGDFGEYQVDFLKPPYEVPKVKPSGQFTLPAVFTGNAEYVEEQAPPPVEIEEPSPEPFSKAPTKQDLDMFKNIKLIKELFAALENEQDPFPSVGPVTDLAPVADQEALDAYAKTIEQALSEENVQISLASHTYYSRGIGVSTEILGDFGSYRDSMSVSEVDEVSEMSESMQTVTMASIIPSVNVHIEENTDDWMDSIPGHKPIFYGMEREDSPSERVRMLPLPPAIGTTGLFGDGSAKLNEHELDDEYMENLAKTLEVPKQVDALEKLREAMKVLQRHTPWHDMSLPVPPMEPPVDQAKVVGPQDIYGPNLRSLCQDVISQPRRMTVKGSGNIEAYGLGGLERRCVRSQSVRKGQLPPGVPRPAKNEAAPAQSPRLRTLSSSRNLGLPPTPENRVRRTASAGQSPLVQSEDEDEVPLAPIAEGGAAVPPYPVGDPFDVPSSVPSLVLDPMTIEKAPMKAAYNFSQMTRSEIPL